MVNGKEIIKIPAAHDLGLKPGEQVVAEEGKRRPCIVDELLGGQRIHKTDSGVYSTTLLLASIRGVHVLAGLLELCHGQVRCLKMKGGLG